MIRQPSFETSSPGQRLVWAMQLVHIPEEGLTPAQFLLRAGKLAGLEHGVTMSLIKVFYTKHGRGKRIMRPGTKQKTS